MIGDQCGGQGDGSLVPPPEPKCDKGTVLLSPLQNLNNHH